MSQDNSRNGNTGELQSALVYMKVICKLYTSLGDQATEFAAEMGFTVEDIRTNETDTRWINWQNNNCQPNFRKVALSSLYCFQLPVIYIYAQTTVVFLLSYKLITGATIILRNISLYFLQKLSAASLKCFNKRQ